MVNWNPVVDALVEEYMDAWQVYQRYVDAGWTEKWNRAKGRLIAVNSVADKLGLSEQLSKRLDYLLDESEQKPAGL